MVGDYAPLDLPEPDERVRRAFILDRKQPLRAERDVFGRHRCGRNPYAKLNTMLVRSQ
jgi:hypothetical protein